VAQTDLTDHLVQAMQRDGGNSSNSGGE